MSYIVQGCWSDSRIVCEWEVDNPTLDTHPFDAFNLDVWKEKAIEEARIFTQEPTFEGDYVRVITGDGEFVWDSRHEKAERWMREAITEYTYDRAFDLAVDCTSGLELWDDDYTIPDYMITIAESIVGKD